MHETSAQGWCSGKTQTDGMGREEEGGSGWGTHVKPWLIHVNVWQKSLKYCKVISLQLIKINEKKKKKRKGEKNTDSIQNIFINCSVYSRVMCYKIVINYYEVTILF